jgi:protoporphyrinogen oxidase
VNSGSVVIVGAGPAGLSAAFHLAETTDAVIVEGEEEAGGLCRSFDLQGVTFDLGGHAFFTRHDEVRDLVERLCTVGVYRQPRQAWVYSHGRLIPYPFQSHLHGLPVDVVRDCLVGLFECATLDKTRGPEDLEEWIVRSFGEGIARHFLTPYNQKLWSYPLSEVAPTWTGERIVQPNVAAIIGGALSPQQFHDFPNAEVAYPSRGGFWGLYEGFLDHLGNRIRYKSRVDRVDLTERTVTLDCGEQLEYEYLISTMPLDKLVEQVVDAKPCCRRAAATLRHNSLYLVNLVVPREKWTDHQRIYVADGAVPFHKLVFNSNSSPTLRDQPYFGIQAEISFSARKRVDPDNLESRVIEALISMGIMANSREVQATSTMTVPYAYPVYTRDTADIREHLFSMLKGFGVFCAGRFGEWLYINSDDAVLRGKQRAHEIEAMSSRG